MAATPIPAGQQPITPANTSRFWRTLREAAQELISAFVKLWRTWAKRSPRILLRKFLMARASWASSNNTPKELRTEPRDIDSIRVVRGTSRSDGHSVLCPPTGLPSLQHRAEGDI